MTLYNLTGGCFIDFGKRPFCLERSGAGEQADYTTRVTNKQALLPGLCDYPPAFVYMTFPR